MDYERLIRQADQTPFEGWDFGVFRGRFVEAEPPWEFSTLLRTHMQRYCSMLDLGTGGGEFLSSLAPLPPETVATEAYPPNVPIARRRLAPLGVRVFDTTESGDDPLPFADGTFDFVVSRHESYVPSEVRRVLVSGGTFVTQQVGGRNLEELNHALRTPTFDGTLLLPQKSWNGRVSRSWTGEKSCSPGRSTTSGPSCCICGSFPGRYRTSISPATTKRSAPCTPEWRAEHP
jgi:SAM-dependent methyltransferase